MYKVFLVDDEYRVKERILNLTEWDDSPYTFCGEASDGEMALGLINQVKPDIVVTDIEMPFMNGLELAKILKSTMPWIRIIFISGYDDFEYAKEALKIGVSDYILKPFRFDEMKKILDKVVESIEEEKKHQLQLLQMKNKLESAETLKKDNLFEMLISGNFDTKNVMESYVDFDIEILSKFYVVLDIKIHTKTIRETDTDLIRPMACVDFMKIKAFASNQLDKIEKLLWYYRTDDRLLVVLRGDEELELKEQAFALSSSIKYAIEKDNGHMVTIGIGNLVKRIGQISESCRNANKARTYLGDIYLGQIIYIEDINNQMIEASTTEGHTNHDLKRLEVEDVDDFIESTLATKENKSGLFKYYKVINVIVECVGLITDLGGNPTDILPPVNEKELVRLYATDKSDLEVLIREYLEKMIAFKQTCNGNKYQDIIRSAKEYIVNHYADSGISLNTVASHVNLSPNHFSMIFSNETNHTFIEFLTKTRLDKAKEMLLETNRKLALIAEEVGYNEPQYFSYIFKKNIGVSPRDYRLSLKLESKGSS